MKVKSFLTLTIVFMIFASLTASVEQFIPKGYKFLKSETGDLNLDKYPDMILILNKLEVEEESSGIRSLMILLGQQDKSYKLVASNENVLMGGLAGGGMGDPLQGVTIEKGSFSVEHTYGSRELTNTVVTFKYSAEDNNWFLHETIERMTDRHDPDSNNTEIMTTKDFGKIAFDKYEGFWSLYGIKQQMSGEQTESNPAKQEAKNIASSLVRSRKAAFADLKSNWAWAITNGFTDSPSDQLVAIMYSSDDALSGLTIATNMDGKYRVQYSGQKTATGSNGDYNPTFEGVTGPYWKFAEGSSVEGFAERMLLLPESCHDGILTLTYFGENKWFHPKAEESDVAKISALRPGRGMMNTELLATDSRGGRIALFQFNNTAEEGLLILAYILDEKVITTEFTTDVYEGEASWRADADPDDICYFEVTALCDTDEGLFIAFFWGAPEGTNYIMLKEDNGKFVDCITEAKSYDHWSNDWY